ncbi:MAG: alpha/beta hydrolase [Alphaproteobacteria bacterium]|nr:alpha/beta hydrolase [Alphaproteobacteria bacterium]
MERRDFFRLGAAGVAGLAIADELSDPAAAQTKAEARPDTSLMLFPGNYTWSAAIRGVIATSLWGGADLGEVYKVVAALKARAGDNAAWFAEWHAMGRKVEALAEAAAAKGHSATASAAFMRAANYIQTGERLLQPRRDESQAAYAQAVKLFQKGIGEVPYLSIEAVEVPFENGKALPAYFVKSRDAGNAPLPTLVFFDGLDITKEMQYFRGVPEIVKRGIAVLIIDAPGTGEAIRFRGMPARFDSNVAGTAAVNYLETRRDVDRERLAVMGISLGGYYAPRAAAFEPRFKACVSWGAIWDYHATWQKRIEKAFNASLSVPGEHINWVLGVDNLDAALKKLEDWRLAGVAEKVQCAYLLTHGERDAQIPIEDARALFGAIGAKDKTMKVFTLEEGGFEHCQGDNLTIGIAYIADWLSERLVAKRKA